MTPDHSGRLGKVIWTRWSDATELEPEAPSSQSAGFLLGPKSFNIDLIVGTAQDIVALPNVEISGARFVAGPNLTSDPELIVDSNVTGVIDLIGSSPRDRIALIYSYLSAMKVIHPDSGNVIATSEILKGLYPTGLKLTPLSGTDAVNPGGGTSRGSGVATTELAAAARAAFAEENDDSYLDAALGFLRTHRATGQTAAAVVEEVLPDLQAEMQEALLTALGECSFESHDQDAVMILIRNLFSESAGCRAGAVLGIEALMSPELIPFLEEAQQRERVASIKDLEERVSSELARRSSHTDPRRP